MAVRADGVGGAVAKRAGRSAARLATLFKTIAVCSALGLAVAPAASSAAEAVAEPQDYKTTDYRSPVPSTLAGARVVTADEAKALWDGKQAIFVDVYPRAPKPPNLPAGTIWRDPKHATIPEAHWLPNVGYGVLAPDVETYLKAQLSRLTGGDAARPLVFFCLKDCWMSWNAAKRARALGYASVIWFPDGTDGWQGLGLDLVEAQAVP